MAIFRQTNIRTLVKLVTDNLLSINAAQFHFVALRTMMNVIKHISKISIVCVLHKYVLVPVTCRSRKIVAILEHMSAGYYLHEVMNSKASAACHLHLVSSHLWGAVITYSVYLKCCVHTYAISGHGHIQASCLCLLVVIYLLPYQAPVLIFETSSQMCLFSWGVNKRM